MGELVLAHRAVQPVELGPQARHLVAQRLLDGGGDLLAALHLLAHEPLRHLVHSADGFVAAAGSIGTLTEVFLVWTMVSVEGREPAPIVLMGPQWHEWLAVHRGPAFVPERLHAFVEVADTPALAAQAVVDGIARARGAGVAAAARQPTPA